MTEPTFKDLELSGWSAKADAYDAWFAGVTRQAIEPLLDTLRGDYRGSRLLDVCCGTGHLAGEAAKRGADANGIDFAETMIARARKNYPHLHFETGDGEALGSADGAFDTVACAFGILHFADPARGVAEAHRVLRPGGRYGFTVWFGPSDGSEMTRLIGGAIKAHANLDIGLPEAPPMFRYAEPKAATALLQEAGFTQVDVKRLDLAWTCERPEDVLTMIYQSVVRTPMILERQTPEVREAVHREILEKAEDYRRDGQIRLAFPAAMVTATRA